MKATKYRVIKFTDLNQEAQMEIMGSLFDEVTGEYGEQLIEMFGGDPFDLGAPNVEAITEGMQAAIERACGKAWAEMEITITL